MHPYNTCLAIIFPQRSQLLADIQIILQRSIFLKFED